MLYIETPQELITELEDARRLLPDYRQAYDQLSHVFQKYLNQQTSFNTLRLVGTYAKMDYLLKECHAPLDFVRLVNSTRVRLRKRTGLGEDVLMRYFESDLQHIKTFITTISARKDQAEGYTHAPDTTPTPETAADDGNQSGNVDSKATPYLRMLVSAWDDHHFYGKADDEIQTPLKVSYLGTGSDFDYTYVRRQLYDGIQVNLINPRHENGETRAEFIIVEPDFLVDISSIAKCFASYTESPIVYLLSKISSGESTQATLLGDLASQFLDEELHKHPATDDRTAYVESIQTFFQTHAIKLLTTELNDDFHLQAQAQRDNIRRVVQQVLPERIGTFDIGNVMVEPSFYSEMLGMQGRMDFLQLDMRLLIEQKSGKGGWPQPDPHTPVAAETHYVQMLLYMALLRYNYREQYEANNRELQAFLLYSKYDNSMLGLGYSPELVHRAIRIRNGIAWLENYLTKGGSHVLESLTPDGLNTKGKTTLWTRYTRPELEALLTPIHKATPLERAYFHRMMAFLATEHTLSKLGNKTKDSSGFASKWHDALHEKLLAGNIFHELYLDPKASLCDDGDEGVVSSIKLFFHDDANYDMANFRRGDIVALYSYDRGTEPDIRRTLVFRASIKDITTDSITLRLRAPQTDRNVFLRHTQRPWAIEHDLMESTQTGLYRGLYSFLSAPKERRDLILLQREPRVDTSRRLKGEYGAFDELSLRVKQASELFLIIGPPGTGKTSFGMLNTLREELLEPASTVLLLSYTNRAVDEICSKLVAEGIDFLRIGSELTCAESYTPYLMANRLKTCGSLSELRRVVAEARVVVGTTTALTSNSNLFSIKSFSLAIIDEASQILEPHLMTILSATKDGTSAIRKVVMIGDHKQLPAVVQQTEEESRVDDEQLHAIGLTDCRQSLFERLLRRYRHRSEVVYMLTRQGRMHHLIAEFPNQEFYEGHLTEVPLPHQRADLPAADGDTSPIDAIIRTRRVAFIDAPTPTDTHSDKVNTTEASIITRLVKHIYEKEREGFDADRTVGVIVPYRNQIATIRNALAALKIDALRRITIDTVERYQGSQRRYIIYGFTIQRRYQLNFLTSNVFEEDGHRIDRKLNVAMTRAEEHLIMVGNKALLSFDPTFRKMIEVIGTDTLEAMPINGES